MAASPSARICSRRAGASAIRDPITYSASVAAMAAFSDSGPPGRRGIRARTSADSTTSAGRPSRSAPTSSVTGPSIGASTSPAAASRATVVPVGSPRAGGRANTDPMAARTAFGPYGSAVPGPTITGPSASACADRMTVPDVAGVAHAVERDRQLPAGLGPALAVDPDHARARAQLGHPVQQLGLHVLPGPQQHLGLPPRRRRGGHQVVALGHEQPLLVPRLLARELADELELGVVG